MAVSDTDIRYLTRCVELAKQALEAGDEPFGSVLVAADGTVLKEDRNRVASGDHTQHPEFALARWAAANLNPEQRAQATVYTSGEHCPMCSAAIAWVGLGRIWYASSSAQLRGWLESCGLPLSTGATLSIQEVVANVPVDGQVPQLAEKVRELLKARHNQS